MPATASSTLVERWQRAKAEMEVRIEANQIAAAEASDNDSKAMYLGNCATLRMGAEDMARRIAEARHVNS